MQVSLILMLIEYAVNEKRLNIGFIESTALSWLDAGVASIVDAEKQIEYESRRKTAWGVVERAFGIESRLPSKKELEFSENWVLNWGFNTEMLRQAYDICVDAKGKLNMSYINKILESWSQKGYKTVADVENSKKKAANKKNSFSAYDKSLVEKLLNTDD